MHLSYFIKISNELHTYLFFFTEYSTESKSFCPKAFLNYIFRYQPRSYIWAIMLLFLPSHGNYFFFCISLTFLSKTISIKKWPFVMYTELKIYRIKSLPLFLWVNEIPELSYWLIDKNFQMYIVHILREIHFFPFDFFHIFTLFYFLHVSISHKDSISLFTSWSRQTIYTFKIR